MNDVGVTVMSSHPFYLQTQLQAGEECARERRAINISCVTHSTLVKVVLIAVEDVLHSTIELQRGTQ